MQGSADAEPALQERPLVVADNEKISDAAAIPGQDHGDGWWRQCLFVRNGRRVPANWRGATTRWPTAAALFERLLGARHDDASEGGGLGVADSLPKGSIEFSMLAPAAHLKAHCGPSNHRLRIHLPILLPSAGENARARMQVGEGKPRAWVAGQATLFDDSYLVRSRAPCLLIPSQLAPLVLPDTCLLLCQQHEVWNDASTARVVLMVDVWHPDLDEAGREIVRKELGFERAKWFRKDSPWGEEEPEGDGDGGDGYR